jgi:hypothetical protein
MAVRSATPPEHSGDSKPFLVSVRKAAIGQLILKPVPLAGGTGDRAVRLADASYHPK